MAYTVHKARSIMRTCLALLLVAVTAVGCSDQVGSDDDTSLDALVGKADASSVPGGAYTNATPHFGELSTVTLNADHTFTRTALQACPGGGTCAPRTETGKFLLTHSATKHYIHFYTAAGKSLDKYQWQLSLSKLSLNLDGDGEWFALALGASCESAGGNCTALVPDACEYGSVGDATQYSCGGGLGVECCLPLQPDNSCNTDGDCSGSLPHFCKQCEDGTTSCAHWSCLEKACQITSCN